MKRMFLAVLAALLTPATAYADAVDAPRCEAGACTYRVNAQQLLGSAEKLVLEHRFSEAGPLLAALENAPQFAMERDFLLGYTAMETGKTDEAIRLFRRILAKHPEQTRVRLELGRALMQKGKALSADHHFRLAEQDKGLPAEVLDYVRASRTTLRSTKSWSFTTDFGIAPDSNINNATNADSVNVKFGPFDLPMTLDADARRKSGTGQFASFSGSGRFGLSGETRMLVDLDTSITNYKGVGQDDANVQLAAGPEFDLGADTTMSVQALGAHRWYGGKRANHAFGMRSTLQHLLSPGQRLGLTIDGRKTLSGFNQAYSGWQFGAYASYERVLARSLIASATLFARRDSLQGKPYASTETGANLSLGGELPLGLTAGISAGVSRAWFDSPLLAFSAKSRRDWRLNGRVTMGLRTVRVLGFSPSVSYGYSDNRSSLTLYDAERSRLRFALARYF